MNSASHSEGTRCKSKVQIQYQKVGKTYQFWGVYKESNYYVEIKIGKKYH